MSFCHSAISLQHLSYSSKRLTYVFIRYKLTSLSAPEAHGTGSSKTHSLLQHEAAAMDRSTTRCPVLRHLQVVGMASDIIKVHHCRQSTTTCFSQAGCDTASVPTFCCNGTPGSAAEVGRAVGPAATALARLRWPLKPQLGQHAYLCHCCTAYSCRVFIYAVRH